MNIHELRLRHEAGWIESWSHFPRLIREHKLQAGVEIGVAFGGHAEALLDQTEIDELLGVDPYEHRPGYDDTMNLPQEQFENLFWFTMGRLARFGPRYNHVRGTSEQAARILNVEIDFVYIDAEHSFEAVTKDLGLWYSKVRSGGIIGGHDYGYPEYPGVKKAVDEFFAPLSLPVHVEAGTVWWVQKNV